MDLYIEGLTGAVFELKVSPFETIKSVKTKIQQAEGIPITQQHLIWHNNELKDECSLKDYSIQSGTTLKLVLGMRGGPINTRRVLLSSPSPVFSSCSSPSFRSACTSPQPNSNANNDNSNCNAGTNIGSNTHITLLVFKEGDQINFYRVVDKNDPSLSPVIEALPDNATPNNLSDELIDQNIDDLDDIDYSQQYHSQLNQFRRDLSATKDINNINNKKEDNDDSSASSSSANEMNEDDEEGDEGGDEDIDEEDETVEETAVRQADKNVNFEIGEEADDEEDENDTWLSNWIKIPQLLGNKTLSNAATLKLGRHFYNSHFMSHYNKPVTGVSSRHRLVSETPMAPTNNHSNKEAVMNDVNHWQQQKKLHEQAKLKEKFFDLQQKMKEAKLSRKQRQLVDNANKNKPMKSGNVVGGNGSQSKSSIEANDNGNSVHAPPRSSSRQISRGRLSPIQTKPKKLSSPLPTSNYNTNKSIIHNKVPLSSSLFSPPSPPPSSSLPPVTQSVKEEHQPSIKYPPLFPNSTALHHHTPVKFPTTSFSNHHQIHHHINPSLQNNYSSLNSLTNKIQQLNMLPQINQDSKDCTTVKKIPSGRSSSLGPPSTTININSKPPEQPIQARCFLCNKKTGLATSYNCRCGHNFCSRHRYAETHQCTYDYKSEGRRWLQDTNPMIAASKLPKI